MKPKIGEHYVRRGLIVLVVQVDPQHETAVIETGGDAYVVAWAELAPLPARRVRTEPACE